MPLTLPSCVCWICHQYCTTREGWEPGSEAECGALAMQVSTEMSADIYSRLQGIDVIDTEGYCQWKKCDVPHSCW